MEGVADNTSFVVADKAVSTEDTSSGMEVARIENVLAALLETKVEAMKASSSIVATTTRRIDSAPPSPKRPRLTSSSTLPSQNHHHHHHRHHHHQRQQQHQHYQHRHDKRGRHGYKHRRHSSVPCRDFIQHSLTHHHKEIYKKNYQKAVDSPLSIKKHQKQSRSPRMLLRDIHTDLDSKFELLGIDAEQELAFINFERTREAQRGSSDYRKLYRSACCISHSSAHLKSHYNEDDYLTFDFVDEPDDEETFSSPAETVGQYAKSRINSCDHFHRPRRKRRRLRCEKSLVDIEGLEVDDLPPRARWTIVATACLLLAMSLLLVGVTLRMAPIIDEMDIALITDSMKNQKRRRNNSISSQYDGVNLNGFGKSRRQRRSSEYIEHTIKRSSNCHLNASRSHSHSCTRSTPLGDGRRASVCKKVSISRSRRPSSARRRDSIRPTRIISETNSGLSAANVERVLTLTKKAPQEADLARRRHQRITTLLIATFVFILAASVFTVIITLTHSSFHKPPTGSKELADHRANINFDDVIKQNRTAFRKENEELLNSLNRDLLMPENITALSF